MCRSKLVCCMLSVALGALAADADAQMTTRYRATVPGGMIMIGNTSGLDAAPFVPAPVVGTVGALGTGTEDDGIDVFWRSNSPGAGQATASTSNTIALARSQAILNLPAGASVIYARLYWGARQVNVGDPDPGAVISRTGVFNTGVVADFAAEDNSARYQCGADITSIVRARGSGTYELSGVEAFNVISVNADRYYIGWAMVVIYERDGDPVQEMTLMDGFHLVTLVAPYSTTIFRSSPYSSGPVSLSFFACNGSDLQAGDSVSVNGSLISNALNPSNNIFNSTRSRLGISGYAVGDLPQLTGGPRSTGLIDIDTFDVSASASGPGDVTLQVTSANTSENFVLGAIALAVPVQVGSQPCAGDADGNGVVNFTDITDVLNNFNVVCP